MRTAATLGIFAFVLAMTMIRPRGWSEGWWTVLGAVLVLVFGLESPAQALAATASGKHPLLFLLSLLSLSLLIGKSGFFDWAAIHCAKFAKGDARALYRNTFLLGAAVTALLSLDTTAVILTPVVLALVKRLKLQATPYIFLCAFVANVASLALPLSNLTNILFADAFHLSFAPFAAKMIAPQIVALVATYALLAFHFRRDLGASFAIDVLPAPRVVLPDARYFAACVVALGGVLVGYFVAPLFGIEPYVVAFVASGALVVAAIFTVGFGVRDIGELSWGVFPFVIGLFIVVRAVENLGVVDVASRWLASMPPASFEKVFFAMGATTVAANVTNNLPAALLARSVLATSNADATTILAALIGADIGSAMMPLGSLATMLVFALARREGPEVRAARFVLFALWAMPLVLIATTLTLFVLR